MSKAKDYWSSTSPKPYNLAPGDPTAKENTAGLIKTGGVFMLFMQRNY
jgi:hypothetical protein